VVVDKIGKKYSNLLLVVNFKLTNRVLNIGTFLALWHNNCLLLLRGYYALGAIGLRLS